GIHRTLTEALDDALAMRAAALPRLVGVDRPVTGQGGRLDENVPLPPGDRFVIRTDLGQTIARSAQIDGAPSPRVVDRQTVRLADGTRLRSVSVAVDLAEGDDAAQPAMIVYSTPMDALDAILLRLMVVFLAVGAGSAIGAVV